MMDEQRTFSGPMVLIDGKDIKTGIDAIRARTWSVWRRGNFAGLARDSQAPINDLTKFVTGEKPRLADDIMRALTKILFHGARFNPETGMLESTAPPPTTAAPCGPPAPWRHPNEAIARAQDALHEAQRAAQPPMPRPKPQPAQPQHDPFRRPGFAHD